MSYYQNSISHQFLQGSDLASREKEVLRDVVDKTGFVPGELINKSSWWGSQDIGAIFYSGKYKDEEAVLKIQGIKPQTSEAYMIESFQEVNKSNILRPPHLYAVLPWNEEKRYEALIMENVRGEKIVNVPTNDIEIRRFYDIFEDYRRNCLSEPWVEKPKESLREMVVNNFAKWREAGIKLYPTHPLRHHKDRDLVDRAVHILASQYSKFEPVFMHGHFGFSDLYKTDDKIIILSNLYWGWRWPFYDAVFGFSWFMYRLSDIEGITIQDIEVQRMFWQNSMHSLTKDPYGKKMFNLALLERFAAGLNLDALTVNPQKHIAKYIVQKTREDLIQQIEIASRL